MFFVDDDEQSLRAALLPLLESHGFIVRSSKVWLLREAADYVTHNTKTIAGVTTVVVHDQVYLDTTTNLIEDTFDWYAQDNQGSVWYFGEDATQYKNGVVTGHAGSWQAGVNGAQPGIVMEANPQVGDTYCQENVPGIAQDEAKVLSLTDSRCVPYGCFSGNVLTTKEFSPLEPGKTENKFYAPGIGLLEAIAVTGGNEDIQLVAVESGV